METTYDTIVIGSGCGGAAAAALMSYFGHKTLLVEKNNIVGGRAAQFERDGFKLDHGHVLARCNKGPHGEVLRIVKCKDLIPKYSYLRDWPIKAYLGDKFIDIYPNSLRSALKGDMFRIGLDLKVTFGEMIAMGLMSAQEFFMTKKRLKKIEKIDLNTRISKFKINPYFRASLEGLSVGMFGAPAWEASAAEMIRIFRNMGKDMVCAGYPVNGEGVSAIPKSFLRAAERMDAKVMTNAPVEEIIIENGVAKGVIVNGEKFWAKHIISNAGIMPTVTKLAGREHFESSYVNRIENLQYSCSGLSFKFALDKKITDYVWGGEIPLDVEESYLGMIEGKVPEKFIFMFFATSNIDPSLAPKGCQTISCISGGPLVEPGNFDWEPWMAIIRKQIENMLPGINDHIVYCREETPDHIAKFNGRFYGDAVGAAQTTDQMGDLRPSMISPVKGLYHVGADVGWGSMATEAATLSAIYLYNHFMKEKMNYRNG